MQYVAVFPVVIVWQKKLLDNLYNFVVQNGLAEYGISDPKETISTVNNRRYNVRDPIHGFIELTPLEIKLINTRVFQRLRLIKQLALACLVYPGATHTRFGHSLGTRHVAGRICDEINKKSFPDAVSDPEKAAICVAALLHDIGHGPFSHVSEYLLEQYRPAGDKIFREKIHERITAAIIEKHQEIGSILDPSPALKKRILELVHGPDKPEFSRYIISSDFDADKLDYLMRDAYYAGVQYGIFDMPKLIESCLVHRRKEESRIALSSEAIYAFEQMLLAKYHMLRQVYRHRIRCITDAMLVRTISLAIDLGNKEMSRLYRYEDGEEFINYYLDFYDEKVISVLKDCEQPIVRNYMERLFDRRLFKRIYSLALNEHQISAIRRMELMQLVPGDEETTVLEKRIAEELRLEPTQVIVFKYSIKNPAYEAPGWSIDEEQILFIDQEGNDKTLAQCAEDELIISTSKEFFETLEVYAPMDHWNDLDQKQREMAEDNIREKIDAVVRA